MAKFIAVDLGTTKIKCVLFDQSGAVLASESAECRLEYPARGFVEQDASLWYEGVCGLIRRLIAGTAPAEILGLSVCSQGISVVPVDEDGRPLRRAISWLDRRKDEERRILEETIPEEACFAATGKTLGSGWTLGFLLWIRRHEPEIFEKARLFLLPMDYLNLRLTGNAVTDHTMASGTMYYHVAEGGWYRAYLELVGVKETQLPRILPAGAPVGPVNEETMRLTGLTAATVVFNGGQDQKVAAYAAGADMAHVSLSLGTAGAMEIFVTEPEKQQALCFFPDLDPAYKLAECCVTTTGAAIRWMKDTMFRDVDYAEMNRQAESAPPGSNGVLFYPHLSQPGSPHVGRTEYGSLRGISLNTTRGDLIRSLYEGLAYELRLNLECAASVGSRAEELIVFGGASESKVFCQILADVTGMPLAVTANSEMGAVGAARLAVKGCGLDDAAFAAAAAGERRYCIPDPEAAKRYEVLYHEYKQYYQ